jgi:two-component system, cell cycle sensor histidine kinase and response regulator CckA
MNKAAASESKVDTFLRDRAEPSLWPAEMCKLLIESSPWPMFVLDCETCRVMEVNDAAIKKYGHSRLVFLERGVEEVIPAEFQDDLRQTLALGLNGPVREYSAEHRLADGTRIPVDITSFPLSWNGRPARFSMVHDSRSDTRSDAGAATRSHARRNPESAHVPWLTPAHGLASDHEPAIAHGSEQPSRGDTLLSVPGTAAHDFNNLLTVILAVAEQMQEGEGDPEQQAELIAKTVRNAQDLAQQRLLLGYQQQSRREQIHLNAVLREQADVLRAVLGKDIDLEMDFDDDLWPVFGDCTLWREVLLNLAMNARDAMPEGGKFYVSTRRVLLASDDAELGLAHGRYVHLVVRDTGVGMTPETRLHAFEPYFSTKSRAKNSGLGLASVYGVVRQSGGGIRLTSAPKEGARFDMFIPAQDNTWTEADGSLVLLVEDADELRKLIQDFLTGRGYEVISCGSAEAAMQWARSLARPLDLVISDVILPDVTGEILVEQVRLQHPEAKVVLMSGQERALIHGPAAEYAICLQKPFSLHQLAKTVSELLQATPGGNRLKRH